MLSEMKLASPSLTPTLQIQLPLLDERQSTFVGGGRKQICYRWVGFLHEMNASEGTAKIYHYTNTPITTGSVKEELKTKKREGTGSAWQAFLKQN